MCASAGHLQFFMCSNLVQLKIQLQYNILQYNVAAIIISSSAVHLQLLLSSNIHG